MKSAAGALLLLTACGATGCSAEAPPYASCGDGVGCSRSRCIELLYTLDDGSEAGGAFCSARCEEDVDCPDGGVCVTVDVVAPLRFVCVSACSASSDCFSGSRCTALVGPSDVTRACLPDGR